MSRQAIPSYDLYADARHDPVPGFLHAERIGARARLHDWTIAPHRHAGMWQALLLAKGGGAAMIDGRDVAMEPSWLAWVPAGVVHGYRFLPDTDGVVVTAARDLLDAALRRDDFAPLGFLRDRSRAGKLDDADPPAQAAAAAMEGILAELGLSGFGGRAAATAQFDLLLVALARIMGPPDQGRAGAGDDLANRFRALAEAHFREQWPLTRYAAALGVTVDRLYGSVRAASGRSPQAVLHDRLLIEAKRGLLYTTMSVGEIAYGLGFEDPAYFTRFFVRRAGCPPTVFRTCEGDLASGAPAAAPRRLPSAAPVL